MVQEKTVGELLASDAWHMKWVIDDLRGLARAIFPSVHCKSSNDDSANQIPEWLKRRSSLARVLERWSRALRPDMTRPVSRAEIAPVLEQGRKR